MNLPFIYLSEVYHAGVLSISNQRINPRHHVKMWDFEFGLLSVSLDPVAWSANWSNANTTTYKLTSSSGALKMLDADVVLQNYASDIEQCAISTGLLVKGTNGLQGTPELYLALNLTQGSLLPSQNRSPDDWLLQTSLAVLASQDPTIDGLWWSDTLGGAMRAERGGIYQHLLSRVIALAGAPKRPAVSPAPTLEASTVLT